MRLALSAVTDHTAQGGVGGAKEVEVEGWGQKGWGGRRLGRDEAEESGEARRKAWGDNEHL